MTTVISNSILPSTQIDNKSIFTIKKMVLADKEVYGSFVGQSISPQIRIGAYEVRLFIYENESPQYQLILTNFNGKLIWFSNKDKGWFTLTNITPQRDFIDYIIQYPGVTECIEEVICVHDTSPIPTPPTYIGSVTSGRIEQKYYGKVYCGDDLIRKINKWR